jgi:hypothetical protein
VSGASSDDVVVFRARYHVNTNPVISAATIGGAPLVGGDGSPTPVTAGATVRIHVEWPTCPATDTCGDGVCGADESKADCADDCGGQTPKGCTGAERYVFYDSQARSVVVLREDMRVSYYATGGTFAQDRTGVTGDDGSVFTENDLTLPTTTGSIRLWLVLRDARGGIGWGSYVLTVQ